MDVGRVFTKLLRFYVWALVLLGLGTVVFVLLPQKPSSGPLAATWFAVAGFGALVLVIIVMIELYE